MPVLKRKKSEGPMGGAGLIRYFDVDEGGPKMSPKLIVGIAVAMVILEVMTKIILA